MAWSYEGQNLYSTAAWQRLRVRIIKRDMGLCQMCGIDTDSGRDSPSSAEVDHKTPHKGRRSVFFDPDNLQLLCKSCHSSAKAIQERGQRMQRSDGWTPR